MDSVARMLVAKGHPRAPAQAPLMWDAFLAGQQPLDPGCLPSIQNHSQHLFNLIINLGFLPFGIPAICSLLHSRFVYLEKGKYVCSVYRVRSRGWAVSQATRFGSKTDADERSRGAGRRLKRGKKWLVNRQKKLK